MSKAVGMRVAWVQEEPSQAADGAPNRRVLHVGEVLDVVVRGKYHQTGFLVLTDDGRFECPPVTSCARVHDDYRKRSMAGFIGPDQLNQLVEYAS